MNNKILKFSFIYYTRTTPAVEDVIFNAPIGWNENFFNIDRSVKTWGYFNEYSQEFEFVKKDAEYLRRAFYNFSTGDYYRLKIQKLDKVKGTYSDYKTFNIDLFSFEDTHDSVKVVVTYMELSRILKSNKSKAFEFISTTSYGAFYQGAGPKHMLIDDFQDVASQLIDAMTGGGVSAGFYAIDIDSSLFTFVDGKIAITVGKSISDNTGTGYNKIKTSFDEFYETLDMISSCAMKIEDVGGVETIYIVPKDEAFVSTEILNVGNVANFKLSVNQELSSTSIKFGWPKQDNEPSYNWYHGEINGTTEYGYYNGYSPLRYEMTSKYRADFVGFAFIRNQVNSEDDIFVVFVEYDAPDWITMEGILGKTDDPGFLQDTFNIFLSPRRCALRNIKFLNSIFNDNLIYFFNGDYESSINRSYHNPSDATWIIESDNITIDKSNALFLPYKIEFDAAVPDTFYELYQVNKFGYISFVYEGNTYKGFIMKAKINPENKSEVSFELLSTIDNDLTTLIR